MLTIETLASTCNGDRNMLEEYASDQCKAPILKIPKGRSLANNIHSVFSSRISACFLGVKVIALLSFFFAHRDEIERVYFVEECFCAS